MRLPLDWVWGHNKKYHDVCLNICFYDFFFLKKNHIGIQLSNISKKKLMALHHFYGLPDHKKPVFEKVCLYVSMSLCLYVCLYVSMFQPKKFHLLAKNLIAPSLMYQFSWNFWCIFTLSLRIFFHKMTHDLRGHWRSLKVTFMFKKAC